MAEISSFFNSINGDRKYDAAIFAKYFGRFISNGYFPEIENSLKVLENDGMTTLVKKGAAYINGYMYETTEDLVLTHDLSDGVLKRIDRIVVRLDYSNRLIRTAVKKGAPGSSPIAPPLQRDNDIYELALADVLINNGVTAIVQANITDNRRNDVLCGVVNNLFANDSNIDANSISIEDANNYYDSTNVEGALTETERKLNVHRLNYDAANDIFVTVEYRRTDTTLKKKSVLSNLDGDKYLTQTVTYYDLTGVNVVKTESFSITYDDNGNVISEVRV